MLATGDIDLALVYDYNLAPMTFEESVISAEMWSAPWSLGVPAAAREQLPPAGHAATVFGEFRDHPWIVNSRNTADEDVVRIISSMAGFEPRVVHRADSLELVEDLIVAGLGVGLLPAGPETNSGVTLLALSQPDVQLRAHAIVRRGHAAWPPLALALDLLRSNLNPTGDRFH